MSTLSHAATTVLVVDDQTLVRDGFAMILDAQPDLEVVGTAADGASAVRECARLRPDVVLMDVRMPVMDGLEAARRICSAGPTKVLMLTTFDVDEYVYEAIRAGASGFLLKDVPAPELCHGVRAIAAGETLLASSVTRRLIESFVRRPAPGTSDRLGVLTPRERDVLGAVGRGLSNLEIAAALFVSETTVKTHLGRVLTKIGLRDRVQAVVFAYESGLIQPGEAPS